MGGRGLDEEDEIEATRSIAANAVTLWHLLSGVEPSSEEATVYFLAPDEFSPLRDDDGSGVVGDRR